MTGSPPPHSHSTIYLLSFHFQLLCVLAVLNPWEIESNQVPSLPSVAQRQLMRQAGKLIMTT